MGRVIDENKPFSPEDKQYLIDRGRGYKIPANERRFGVNGDAEPVEGEEAGQSAVSPFYDPEPGHHASYDVGGAPLPGAVLDHNTKRVYDRDNGVIVEPTGMGLQHSGSDLAAQRDFSEDGKSADGDDIDADIAEYVLDKKKTIPILKDKLDSLEVEYSSDDNKQDLQEKLAIKLQDDRDEGNEIDLS